MAAPLDDNNMAICAMVIFAMQLSFLLIAVACKFDRTADFLKFAGGTNFVVLALLTFLLAQLGSKTGWYVLYRIIKIDKQVDDKPQTCCGLVGYWMFQINWVFTVNLPVLFINSPENAMFRDYWTAMDIVGLVFFCIGLIIETVADQSKFMFRNNPANEGKWCSTGIWKVSRRPNYFGEILLWLGIFIISTSVLTNAMWVAVLSPFYVIIVLLFQSVRPQERWADVRYCKNEEYREYKNRTSVLIPLPPGCYGCLPRAIKCLFCCEFPLYNHLDEETQKINVTKDMEAGTGGFDQPSNKIIPE